MAYGTLCSGILRSIKFRCQPILELIARLSMRYRVVLRGSDHNYGSGVRLKPANHHSGGMNGLLIEIVRQFGSQMLSLVVAG
jgi:hypothetical protein